MTYVIMFIVVLFLGFVLLFGAQYVSEGGTHLFDKDNSTAMRGFWSIIVILVHIPATYSNRIQDMIGSFAYIGVTFFFMTSAYGLTMTMENRPESIKKFWRNRLPKLIIPMIFVNIINFFLILLVTKEVDILQIIRINSWVKWLLICYLIFWIVNRFINLKQTQKDIIVCLCVIAWSVVRYCLKSKYPTTSWCTECVGFIWGILFFRLKTAFSNWSNNKWILKTISACLISGVVGLAYLKFKPIEFWGDYVLKILLGFLILFFILLFNRKIRIGNKLALFLGRLSYETYLLHGIIFAIVTVVIPEVESGIFIIVSIILTIAIGYIVNLLSSYAIRGYR